MTILWFILCLHGFQEAFGTSITSTRINNFNERLFSSGNLFTVKCYILEDCAILCKNKYTCRSFLYQHENKFCRGFDDVFMTSGPSVQSPGAVYFVMDKGCPAPPVYSRAIIHTAGYTTGSIVTYTCHVGYSPNSTTSTCNPDGTWSNTTILCQDCILWGSDFKRIPDLRIDPTYNRTGLYTVKIKAGMTLNECKQFCLEEDSCKVFYFGMEHNRSACYKYTERIYDDPQLLANYVSDVMFDEYIRTCLM